MRPRLIIILGPTASGKSALGVAVARALGGEILSADSMQVYRGMDIGTAKPTAEERGGIPHHLIDIRNPDEDYSAADFSIEGRRIIHEKAASGIPIVVVGGTGLYLRALLHGLFAAPAAQPEIRERLRQRLAGEGVGALHAELARRDPEAAARIRPNDPVRIIRALEVIESTGRTISEGQRQHNFSDQPFHTLKIGIQWERAMLYRRIDRRVAAMRESGLLGEVRRLMEAGYGPQHKPMNAIGYRECVTHLQGTLDGTTLWDEIARNTRRFAKRQQTWFKPEADIHWVAPGSDAEVIEACRRFMAGREETMENDGNLRP